MKFKSSLVTQVSGSVGGITGAHNQGGLYFRSRAIPTNPATAQQVAVRNFLSQLTTAWQETLTASQREAWETYAENVPIIDRLGDPRSINGIAMYVRCNTPRLQAGLDRVDDGPTIFDKGTFTDPTLDIAAGSPAEISVAFNDDDAWVDESGSAMLVYTSRQQSPSINFFKGPYRFANLIEGDDSTPPTTPELFDTAFDGSADNAMFTRILVTRADGRLSPVSRFRNIILEP